MSGVYWSLTALHVLRSPTQVEDLMGVCKMKQGGAADRQAIVDWVFKCYDQESGGFGGNVGHDGHLLYTLSAMQILALADRLDDERLVKTRVVDFIANLQQPDGSFKGDKWGEIDTRFTYCALSALSILQSLHQVNARHAAEYIVQCRNLDGGFGSVIGAESHAGQGTCRSRLV
jgi:geranylgeranyl transferase type-2 subunit beta